MSDYDALEEVIKEIYFSTDYLTQRAIDEIAEEYNYDYDSIPCVQAIAEYLNLC